MPASSTEESTHRVGDWLSQAGNPVLGGLKAWWLATTNRWRTTPALHRSPTKPVLLQSDQRTLGKPL